MSTITKERVAQFIKNPLDNGLTRSEQMELARIALASLEDEPVAWRSLYYENHGLLTGSKNVLASWQKQGWECEPLYTAPPAPVAVPTFDEWLEIRGNKPLGWVKDAMRESYDACRAAMLQGAENAESPTTMQTAPSLDSPQIIAESPSGNSPVNPDGWVMVPVEPTMEMLDEFDSIIDHGAEDSKEAWSRLIAAAPQQDAKTI